MASNTKVMADNADGRSKPRPGIEAQRELIRETAAALFVEQGSGAVSISQICQRAEISRPTFYRCFADKEALIDSLYQLSIFEPVQRILLASLPGRGQDPEWLRATLDDMLDAIFEHAAWAELVFAESNNPGSPAYAIVNAAFDRAAAVVQLWLRQQGLPALSAKLLKSVMAACQWLVHDAIRTGAGPAALRAAKEDTWRLVSTLLAGLK